jgi:uncharacterized protein
MKPTLVIGASENPERYSFKAINMLLEHYHAVFAYSIKAGNVAGIEFMTELNPVEIDTVTLYVGEKNQDEVLRNYIISLNPKRVIFNPGTENEDFAAELITKGIEAEEACTLVLLQTEQY